MLLLVDADADAYMASLERTLLITVLISQQFKDEYYSSSDGGRKAALDLQAQVKDHLTKVRPDLAGLPVITKAYVNGDGASKFLSRVGMMQPSVSFWEFGQEFSQAHPTSDFIFVGNGKDRADKKLNGNYTIRGRHLAVLTIKRCVQAVCEESYMSSYLFWRLP